MSILKHKLSRKKSKQKPIGEKNLSRVLSLLLLIVIREKKKNTEQT